MSGMNHKDELKKENDHLMLQLQHGISELKTTVSRYPRRQSRGRADDKLSTSKEMHAQEELYNGEVQGDHKRRRFSQNTSTPKTDSKGIDDRLASSLVSDVGNLRPTPKRNARGRNDVKRLQCGIKQVSRTPQNGKENLNISRKSLRTPSSVSRTPQNGKKNLNTSRKSLRTPLSVSNASNLRPSRKENLNQSRRKSAIKSILHKQSKTPSKGNRVYFSPTVDGNHSSPDVTMDATMMGYDWIAGMIENDTSINDRSDNFFDELKEFRKENWNECKGIKCAQTNAGGTTVPMELSPTVKFDDEKEGYPLCCKGNGAYMVNTRLNLEPIHGPYSACPTCKSKPISQVDADGYIRVSIPRSNIKSPYRLRPHRRKSFDPSDSVALSMHCLAGWEASKPACIRGPRNIDLVSHTAKPGLRTVQAMKKSLNMKS